MNAIFESDQRDAMYGTRPLINGYSLPHRLPLKILCIYFHLQRLNRPRVIARIEKKTNPQCPEVRIEP